MLGVAANGGALVPELGVQGAIFYGILLIVAYELLIRWPYTSYEKRRRDRKAGDEALRRYREEQAVLAQRQREQPILEREAAELETRQAADPDPLRRRYYLALKAVEAQRAAAVQAFKQAGERRQEILDKEVQRVQRRIDEEVGSLRAPPNEPTA